MRLLLLVHAGATLMMLGVILVMQVVHYPLFARVGTEEYTAYQKSHMRRITGIVLPAMSAELGTAAWIAFDRPPGPSTPSRQGHPADGRRQSRPPFPARRSWPGARSL